MPRIIREEELEKLVSRLDNPASNMSAFGEIIKCGNTILQSLVKFLLSPPSIFCELLDECPG